MAAESVTMDDKKEKNSEAETVEEEQPQPKVEDDKPHDTPSLNQKASNLTPESNDRQIDAGQSSITLYRKDEICVSVSQPAANIDSLCTRILEDWPDIEESLPPVADL